MEQAYKNCQSCGMPLNKDPEHGGTNPDGSRSKMYCSKCYANGNFTNPAITLSEMQTLVKGKLKSMGFPGFLAGFFTKNMGQLQRWKNNSW